MNYEDLINLLLESFKTGIPKNITADKLREALIKVVEFANITRGDFQGTATPSSNPGTPDGPVYYFAKESGTYSNFGGITVNIVEGISVLSFNGSVWEKIVIPINSEGFVTTDDLRNSILAFFSINYNEKFKAANLPVRRYNSESTFTDLAAGTYQEAIENGLLIKPPQIGGAAVKYKYETGIIFDIGEINLNLTIVSNAEGVSGAAGIGYKNGDGQYISYSVSNAGALRKTVNYTQTTISMNPEISYTEGDNISYKIKDNRLSFFKNGTLALTYEIPDTFVGSLIIDQTGFYWFESNLEIQANPIKDYVDNSVASVNAVIGGVSEIIINSKNLIDKSKVIYGYYNNSGELLSSVNTIVTPLIIIDSSKLVLSLNSSPTIGVDGRLFFYDEDKNFISKVNKTEPVENVAIPENARYVAVNIYSVTGGVPDATNNPQVNGLQLEYGPESTDYETFGKKILKEALPANLGLGSAVTITVEDANNFTVHSLHDSGEIVSHTWRRLNLPDKADIGWYAPSIIHKGNTIVQGSFNWIHMTAFENENTHVGHAHGCEIDKKALFYLDGKQFEPAEEIGNTLEGEIFSFDIESEIYAADTIASTAAGTEMPKLPLELSSRHYMNGEIRGNSKTKNHNKLVIMRDNTRFSRCYLGMHLGFQAYFDRLQVHNVENTMNNIQDFTPIAPSTASLSGAAYDTADGFRGELAHSATSYSDRFGYIFRTKCRAGTDEMQKKMFVQVAGTSKCYFHPVITTVMLGARGLPVDIFNKGDVIEGVVERELIL